MLPEPDIEMENSNSCSSSDDSDDDNIIVTINKVSNLTVFDDSGIQDHDTETNDGGAGEESSNRKEADGAEEKSQIRFSPPIYIQRYLTVREVLVKHLTNEKNCPTVPKTIVEVGSAELNMHKYWKNIHGSVQKIVYVDKDEHCLEENKNKLHPFACEYLCKRETPLAVEAYAGCITKCDPKIFHAQPQIFAVVGIELIEHLDPPIVLKFEKTIFGLITPPLVIITTPNSEFNQVFGLEPGKFRHWDHRFEWSREEFHNWAQKICNEYEGYKYEISGIGSGPEGTEIFGTVSQMAVFVKENEPQIYDKSLKYPGILEPDCYKLIIREDYPFFHDDSPREEQITKGLLSYINCYIFCYSFLQEFRDEGLANFSIPLSRFLTISGIPKQVTIDELRIAMQSLGHKVQENSETGELEVIFEVPEEEDESSFTDEDEEDMVSNQTENYFSNPETLPDIEEDWE